ncbi:MAG: patatin-like phospholipase family protein [Alphaproteobacteria bacterium]|jgi:predicted acylesterase/phospholipase RssA|nr:patatin-like phospholipase family protein [Alphaproteobacteria bacterium]
MNLKITCILIATTLNVSGVDLIPDSPRSPRHLDERYTLPREVHESLQRIKHLLGELTIGKGDKGDFDLARLRYFDSRGPQNKEKYTKLIQRITFLLNRKIEVIAQRDYNYEQLAKLEPLTQDDLELLHILKKALTEVEKPLWEYSSYLSSAKKGVDYTESQKVIVTKIVSIIDKIFGESKVSFTYTKVTRAQRGMLEEAIKDSSSIQLSLKEIEAKIKEHMNNLYGIYWSLGLTQGGISFPPYSSLPNSKVEMESLMLTFYEQKARLMDKLLAVDILQHLSILDFAIDAFNEHFFNGGKPPVVEGVKDALVKLGALVISVPYGLYKRYATEPTEVRVTKMAELSKQIQSLCLQYLIKSDSTFVHRTLEHLDQVEMKLKEKLENYKRKDEIWILSLDGGGIRGIIAGTVLDDISKKLKVKIPEIFDLFAGTSTGGIIALGLTIPLQYGSEVAAHQAGEVLNLYLQEGNSIFPTMNFITKTYGQAKDAAYLPENIENLFFKYFGTYPMSATTKPVIVATLDKKNKRTEIISSFHAISDPAYDFPIWRSARSTSAAPTYFPPHLTKSYGGLAREFVDGGVTTNNPVHEALMEARKIYPAAKKINIVSIGTGKALFQEKSKRGGSGGLKGALDTFSNAMEDSEKKAEELLKRDLEELKQNGYIVAYYRLNPDLPEKIDLDDVGKDNIFKLNTAAKTALDSEEYKKLQTALEVHLASRQKK